MRTAEEWGRLAVSLPGWRWMLGMLARPLGYRALRVDGEGQTWGVCQDEQTDQSPWPFAWDWLPDPDDPATAGCLLALLGPGEWDNVAPGCAIDPCGEGWWAWVNGDYWPEGMSLGRACIAAAEDLGRWPGGAE